MGWGTILEIVAVVLALPNACESTLHLVHTCAARWHHLAAERRHHIVDTERNARGTRNVRTHRLDITANDCLERREIPSAPRSSTENKENAQCLEQRGS